MPTVQTFKEIRQHESDISVKGKTAGNGFSAACLVLFEGDIFRRERERYLPEYVESNREQILFIETLGFFDALHKGGQLAVSGNKVSADVIKERKNRNDGFYYRFCFFVRSFSVSVRRPD